MITEIRSGNDVLTAVVATLGPVDPSAVPPVYPTDAQDRVFRPGDWPSQDGQYPLLKARVFREFKQSLGRSGTFQFIVTTTVRIEGQVSAPAAVGDAGAGVAEAALWKLARQVEVAVIGSYPLSRLIQNFSTVDTQLSFSADGETHLAGVQIDIGIEWFADESCFAPIEADALTSVHSEVTNLPGNPDDPSHPRPGFTLSFEQ